MTANKIQIEPYKYNLRCSVPGCKNKGDFEVRRRPGNLMVMCEACMHGIGDFISGAEESATTVPFAAATPDTAAKKTTAKKTRKTKEE